MLDSVFAGYCIICWILHMLDDIVGYMLNILYGRYCMHWIMYMLDILESGYWIICWIVFMVDIGLFFTRIKSCITSPLPPINQKNHNFPLIILKHCKPWIYKVYYPVVLGNEGVKTQGVKFFLMVSSFSPQFECIDSEKVLKLVFREGVKTSRGGGTHFRVGVGHSQ